MKQHDDLIQALRWRKDEYHPPLPADGWERLEAELASPPVRHRMLYRWIAAAAVALLCVALSLPWLLKEEVTETEKTDRWVTDTRPVIPETTEERQAMEVTSPVVQIGKKAYRPTNKRTLIPETLPEEMAVPDIPDADVDHTIPDEQPVVPSATNNRQPVKPADMGPQPETSSLTGLPNGKEVKKQRQKQYRWSAGVQAGSNAMLGSGGSYLDKVTSPVDSGPDYTDPDNPEEPESLTKAIPSPPGRKDGDAYLYDHQLQLSTGFMLRRQLSEQFAVETGLSYTYLYSDIRKEETGKMSGNQKVHYLGIPLRANWIFYRQGRFATYLSAGVMAEYCLSARIQLDNANYSPDINRWEWSLNTAVGVQYTLAKPVALFLEPGVSYYFDSNNHNAFETIRTANPLTFNLQLGVRFSY